MSALGSADPAPFNAAPWTPILDSMRHQHQELQKRLPPLIDRLQNISSQCQEMESWHRQRVCCKLIDDDLQYVPRRNLSEKERALTVSVDKILKRRKDLTALIGHSLTSGSAIQTLANAVKYNSSVPQGVLDLAEMNRSAQESIDQLSANLSDIELQFDQILQLMRELPPLPPTQPEPFDPKFIPSSE